MTSSELIELIEMVQSQKCATNYIEVKSAVNGNPKIYDTLSSFSNQANGGTIIFGLDERNDLTVCGIYDANDLQRKIAEQCLQMVPPVRVVISAVNIEDKTVLSAEIPEISQDLKPCFYGGKGKEKGSYIRLGDMDRQMTNYEIYSYETYKKKIYNDIRIPIFEYLPAQPILDTLLVDKFCLDLKISREKFNTFSNDEIKEIYGIEFNNKPTLLGILMFSKYPQKYFRQLSIKATAVQGEALSIAETDDIRFLDNVSIEGTIPEMLKEAMNFVARNTKSSSKVNIDSWGRTDISEYPNIAIREAILNALAHRDYSAFAQDMAIELRIFSNRIEIESPGNLFGTTTLETIEQDITGIRNPYLVKLLEDIHIVENRHTGIKVMKDSMLKHGLPKPEFENKKPTFKVTFFNNSSHSNTDTPKQDTAKQKNNQSMNLGIGNLANIFKNTPINHLFH